MQPEISLHSLARERGQDLMLVMSLGTLATWQEVELNVCKVLVVY